MDSRLYFYHSKTSLQRKHTHAHSHRKRYHHHFINIYSFNHILCHFTPHLTVIMENSDQLKNIVSELNSIPDENTPFPSLHTNTIQAITGGVATVYDSDLKTILKSVHETVTDYINSTNSLEEILVDFIPLIGKNVGWSAIYVLLRSMRKYPAMFNFLKDTRVFACTATKYIAISNFGASKSEEANIKTLIQSRDRTCLDGLLFCFVDTVNYLRTPQYLDDLEKTINILE